MAIHRRRHTEGGEGRDGELERITVGLGGEAGMGRKKCMQDELEKGRKVMGDVNIEEEEESRGKREV